MNLKTLNWKANMKIAVNIALGLSVIALFILYGMRREDPNNIAYVNVQKLYNEFYMKKELEAKLTTVQQARKTILDSLELQLKILSNTLENITKKDSEKENRFIAIREEYVMKKKQFDEDNQAMTQQYSEQIMKQLNEYTQEYGKQKGYRYILGAEGSGGIMYASEKLDITKEVIEYVNGRYKGRAK